MVILLIAMFLFPEKGLTLAGTNFVLPTPNDFFALNKDTDSVQNEEQELKKILDSTLVISEMDSVQIHKKLDSLRRKRDSIRGARKSIQTNGIGKEALYNFFASLEKAGNRKVRIIHYGDSQIESDRITSYIRNEFQKKFGGSGVGLFSVIQVSPKWTLNNTYSKNWKRYVGFGKKDSTITHRKFGALMSFCKFTPINQTDGDKEVEGWIKIKKSKIAYNRIKNFNQLNIYLRNEGSDVNFKIVADQVEVKSGIINAQTPFRKIQVNFSNTPNEIIITFKGKKSPDILGISLESKNGVIIDNVPLRGSSGTLFTRQDADLLKKMYQSLKPDMLILEFGGNTVPYIKTKKQVKDYGNWFKQNIRFLKKLNPDIPILVIGPGDMSYKDKTNYVTKPMLIPVRDAIRDAALSTDCLFWDMFEGMGGKNSMPNWVNTEPALGASDYIHFTPKGAVQISKIFLKEFLKLYDEYKKPVIKDKEVIQHDSIP